MTILKTLQTIGTKKKLNIGHKQIRFFKCVHTEL
jgi:hypothetical protein